MKKIIPLILVILLIVAGGLIFSQSATGNVTEGENVYLVYFYGQGCPHCGGLQSFLNKIQENYPSLKIESYEIYFDNENRQLFEDLSEAFGTEIQGVPTTFINGKVLVGFSSSLGKSIEDEIKICLENGCETPLNKLSDGKSNDVTHIIGESSPTENPEKTELKKKLTIPAVICAAVVDAVNPCAFAVLIILMTTILASSNRKRALFAGLMFSLSIFISYFLMGLGLFSAIQAAGLTRTFYIVVAFLAIIIGLFNLKDYLWYGKWFKMEVPELWRPRMKSLLKGVTSPTGAFFIGFVISLFLLPCTSGPYIVILGLLADVATRNYAIPLLLLYNFIFIMPMLLITFGIYFGITTTKTAEQWRTRKLRVLHLIAGIIILLLGIGMLIALKLGMI